MSSCDLPFFCNDNLGRNKRAIKLISKTVPKCTCLVQAISFKVLSDGYLRTQLVIGISNQGKFKSHAWVCLGEKVVFDNFEENNKYTELVTFL